MAERKNNVKSYFYMKFIISFLTTIDSLIVFISWGLDRKWRQRVARECLVNTQKRYWMSAVVRETLQ